MTIIYSFPPIADDDARILILGSMPGKASLQAGQYYAHPRNQFWPILGELVGAGPALDYVERASTLMSAKIALWDVLKSCYRSSSLDADIDKSSIVVNDFAVFFATHPHIRQVFFNGATAEQAFRRYVLPAIDAEGLVLQRLPSTSPAHAGMSFQQKLQCWQSIRNL
ncbi:MAG: DNA-deoxyinosine glycosylase [Methylobacter sp.]|nr:DNA-deoxyinosine glycosylase [Methylococcales bacterium]MDD5115367.1 DNA-deoxyinosine glycosylase [Methylobacter sp.]